jgi:hypothetical protein
MKTCSKGYDWTKTNFTDGWGKLNYCMNQELVLVEKRRDGRGNLQWRCNRAMHRPSQPTIGFKVGTFFEDVNFDCKTVFKLAL